MYSTNRKYQAQIQGELSLCVPRNAPYLQDK